MKKIFFSFLLVVTLFTRCKKSMLCDKGCYDQPAHFYFVVTDRQGYNLITSLKDTVFYSYQKDNNIVQAYHIPVKTDNSNAQYIIADQQMAELSKTGVKLFYTKLNNKIDTLALDIHAVPATPDNGGNSTAAVLFNNRPMNSRPGITFFDYFVLKRH